MDDNGNDSKRKARVDDLTADDDDDGLANNPKAPRPPPAAASDFSHRMTQVRVGGHHADPSSALASPTSSVSAQKPPLKAVNSVTPPPPTVSEPSTSTSSTPSSIAAVSAAAAATSAAAAAVLTSTINIAPTSSSSLPSPTKASPVTPRRSAGSSSARGLGAGSGVSGGRSSSRKGSNPLVGDMARFGSSQGFPQYPNNPVLSAVSVPFSEQFPVKDAQVGPHHFKRLTLLGRGGIGQVYLVSLRNTDRFYAMKVLTKEDMIQRNKVKRVMTEREILATANHPFIVTMFASFQTADRLCFVMEYCAGGEFFRVLQDQPKKRLKEEAVRFYAAEVILALEYLHHMGFIYRDLKPENILMRENGHIALTDFDLSKQAHSVAPRVIQAQLSLGEKIKKSLSMRRNNSSLTNLEIVDSEPVLPYQTNSFVGTEEYIAPEVVNGEGQSSAVDWWTLGILIYEMLTGTTPFKGNGTDETFSKIVKDQLKWPDDITVSNECKQLVKKLLRREADKRLGAENGASDIKRSKWFKDFNFALIRNEKPPIKPKCKDVKTIKLSLAADQRERERERGGAAGANSTSADHSSADILNNDPENPFVNFNMRRNESLQRQY